MKTFESVYSFDVLREIKKEKLVYVLDKEEQTVKCVNDMIVDKLAEVLKNSETEKTRYAFWIEKEVEETEENENEE